MTTYILLRNNKETAPLTLDELKRLGLKADDLVWVEGQSVCWLNPGQINELKSLVGLRPEPIPHTIQEPTPKKVFVSLPHKEITEAPETPAAPVIESKWAGYAPSNSNADPEPEVVETKYSKPLDEIKEIYLKNLEKKKQGFQVPPQIRKAGLYAALLLTGVIAGILIKKSGAQKETVLAASETKPVPNEIPQTIINPDPNTANYQEPVVDENAGQQTAELVETRKPEVKKIVLNTLPDQNMAVTGKTEPEPSAATETAVSEPEEKKEEDKPVKKVSLNEVRSQVSVKTNNYDVGSFGGIKNLKLTITNHSKYELDKVAVEVQYLKPLNEFLRSEMVSVQSLSPGETKVIDVKKSSRGVKVACKVSSIKSKDFSDDTAGL